MPTILPFRNNAPRPLSPPEIGSLVRKWLPLRDEALLEAAIADAPPNSVAAVSSFGIESAVLLDMVARVDPGLPVIFVDTRMLFPDTLAYRDRLIDRLGLTDVRTVSAQRPRITAVDPDGRLHRRDPDACCTVRKVEPYAAELAAFAIEITGRKRYQGGMRTGLPTVESVPSRIKLNPLAEWTEADIDTAFDQRGLPRHPLWFDGYDSIGCAVCSRRRSPGDAPRAGRWDGSEKTECGIHFIHTDGQQRS